MFVVPEGIFIIWSSGEPGVLVVSNIYILMFSIVANLKFGVAVNIYDVYF